MKRFILWEEEDDGEIPHEFDTLDDMWEELLSLSKQGIFLSTFVAVMENSNGGQDTYTIEDREIGTYYE